MNRRFLSVVGGVFLGGAVAGGAAVFLWVGDSTGKVMKVYTTGLAGEALNQARLLRDGNVAEVQAQREQSLEVAVNWYKEFGYREPGDIRMMHMVKDYRDRWKLPLREDLNVYLDHLPPKPLSLCELAEKNAKP